MANTPMQFSLNDFIGDMRNTMGSMRTSTPSQNLDPQGRPAQGSPWDMMLSGQLWPGYNYFDFNMRNQVPSLGALNSLLSGNQSRAAGQAGAGAAGQAMSMGLANPFASAQRASNNVYQGYADQFANLPAQQFGMASSASGQDWNRLFQIMSQITGKNDRSPNFGETMGANLVQSLPAFLALL